MWCIISNKGFSRGRFRYCIELGTRCCLSLSSLYNTIILSHKTFFEGSKFSGAKGDYVYYYYIYHYNYSHQCHFFFFFFVCVKCESSSVVSNFFVTVACQVPLSMEFSMQEY